MKKTNKRISLLLLISLFVMFIAPIASIANATIVNLGTADSFAILASSAITSTGNTVINGDVGLHPGTSFTDQATTTVNGEIHLADAIALAAKNDLLTAYNNAKDRTGTPINAELGGNTITPGVYSNATSLQLTGTLVLDGGNDPNAVFIFQAGSTLTTATNSVVQLINGANSNNIFWVVGSSATLGTYSTFEGTILASESISALTEADITGRLLALNGAVTLDSNTVTIEQIGSLTVTKNVNGDTSGVTIPEFIITVTGPNSFSENRTLADGESYTWYNLAPGTYSVTENKTGLSGNWVVSGEGDISVVADEISVATITNTYTTTPIVGSLTVGKTVTGNIGSMTLPIFEMTITGPESFVATRTLVHGETFTWNNLVPGTYNVTENKTGLSSNWVVSGEGDITVVADVVSVATIVNAFTATAPVVGSLTVDKTVTGDIGSMTLPIFEMTITGPEGFAATRTFVHGETFTWNNLITGTYNVTENKTGLSSNWTVSGEGDFTVVADETSVATIVNAYTATTTPAVGSLTVTKNVIGDTSSTTIPEFDIIVTGPNSFSVSRTFIDGESYTWNNLTPGTYNVTEVKSGFSSNWVVSGEGNITVVADELSIATIANTYTATPIVGSLTIGKTVAGDIGSMTLPIFEISVTGPQGFAATRTLVHGETFTWNNLVPGTYNVTENRTGLSSNWSVSGDGNITVVANTTSLATIINQYNTPVVPDEEPEVGRLTVEKTVAGDIDNLELPLFTITVTGPRNFSATRTLAHNESFTWWNLVPGTYYVTESRTGLTNEWTVSGEGAVAVVRDELSTVTITNLYNMEPEVGSLTVEKTVSGNMGDMTLPLFRLILSGPEGFSSTRTFVQGESYTWENLVPGTYIVTESRIGLSSEWVASGEGSIAVIENEVSYLSLNNAFSLAPEIGSLTVNKVVIGDIGDMILPLFRITLAGPDGFSSTRTFVNGESFTWGNLLPGTYLVTENRTGMSSEWAVMGEGFIEIEADQAEEITIFNGYEKIELIPQTGQNIDYINPIIFGSIAILMVGVSILIGNKKKKSNE
jgi:hypothetical protein